MSKHPPERPCVLAQDTREPHPDAGDRDDALFRPFVFGPCAKDTPYADRPRIVLPYERRKLDVGDYSLVGLEHMVAIERKSGHDLLATLFGSPGNDALGEQMHNLDRFRAELERAVQGSYFAIVCEASEGWLFTEAKERFGRYGKSFDPFQAIALTRSFFVDLGIPTLWCGTRRLAELEVGASLARIWSQATGGEAARKAEKRGLTTAKMPWLNVLVRKGAGPCSVCNGSGEPCSCNDGKPAPVATPEPTPVPTSVARKIAPCGDMIGPGAEATARKHAARAAR